MRSKVVTLSDAAFDLWNSNTRRAPANICSRLTDTIWPSRYREKFHFHAICKMQKESKRDFSLTYVEVVKPREVTLSPKQFRPCVYHARREMW